MKRILFTALSGLLLLTAGCQRERVESGLSGEVITAHFSVSLPADMATKAISDGSGATELLFRAYDSNGKHLDMDQKVTVEGKKASFTVMLVAGMGYKLVFWAQKPGQYAITHNADGHPVVNIAATALPDMMNNDAYDAFYAFKELDPQDSNFNMEVSLPRPFAQLNVGVSEADYTGAAAGYDLESLFQTGFSVKGVPGAIDLFTGEVSGEKDVTYSLATAPADKISSGQENYRRIAMVYVLAPAEQSSSHNVTLTAAVGKKGNGGQWDIRKDIPNVPLKRNFRTNLLGNVFSVGGTFTVQVDSDFGTPDNTVDLNPVTDPISIPVPEAIDLGLPSGLKWASFNLGASAPEEYGDYYAWGETETKDNYSWGTYKWCKGTKKSLTRYCPSSSPDYWGGEGTTPDGKTDFKDYDYADDAARKLLGGNWRMPTKQEWEELINNCTCSIISRGRVHGVLFEATNGNSIFLPAASGKVNSSVLYADSFCLYWSSQLSDQTAMDINPTYAVIFYADNDFTQIRDDFRYAGMPVRPVLPE